MSAVETATNTAFLYEFLIHEARTKFPITDGDFIVRLYPDKDQNISLSFRIDITARYSESIPKPPAKVIPDGWAKACTETIQDEQENTYIRWSWPAGYSNNSQELAHLMRQLPELLRFCPVKVVVPHTLVTGQLDPLKHNATGIARRLDEETTVILVEEDNEPSNNWNSNEWSRSSERLNIIYPGGVSRHCTEITRYGTPAGWINFGKLEEEKNRAPAERKHVEARIVSTNQNRRRLSHPNLPGISEELRNSARDVLGEMFQEWYRLKQSEGYVTSSYPKRDEDPDQPIVTPTNGLDPYAEKTTTVVRHPVRIEDFRIDHGIRDSIERALTAKTKYTHVPHMQELNTFEIQTIEGVTKGESQETIYFLTDIDESLENIDVEGENGLVIDMEKITCTGIIRHRHGEKETIQFDVPMLTCNSGRSASTIKMFITEETRNIPYQNIMNTLMEACPYFRNNPIIRVVTDTIMFGQHEAFKRELIIHFSRNPLVSRYPKEPVNVTFSKNGISFTEQ